MRGACGGRLTAQQSRSDEQEKHSWCAGVQSDIADGSLRDWEIRKFDFLVGDYYIAPSFLDAVVVSPSKNKDMWLWVKDQGLRVRSSQTVLLEVSRTCIRNLDR